MPFGIGGDAVEQIGVELVAKTGKFFSQVDGAVNKAEGKFGGLAKKVGGAMVKAGALGGIALAGVGVAATKMAIDFEKSMAEVKTLLPDLSEEGFNVLRDDVLDLSKEMGIATSEMVPALYQAISAGIPKENVIEFLRTGAKASIGGVTDLATAVDGLSTVVNAFGYDAAETGRVADVMFTAVKLGKTTMAELSTSMFQAAPLAAALGLDIEDVAAATATLTKSGTPTSVAMTQIRQAMTAMAKPTADMTKLLEKTGYESGEALLQAEGFAGALGVLSEAAEGNKEVMGKAFGSVEALQAVLGLTGENAKVAADDLAAMNDATGASDAAFQEMDKTVSRKIQKAMNNLRVELTKIGIKILPFVAKGIALFSEGLDKAITGIDLLIKYLRFVIEDGDTMNDWLSHFPDEIQPFIKFLGEAALVIKDDLIPALETFGKVVVEAFEIALDVAGPFFKFLAKHPKTLKSVGLALLIVVGALKAYKIAMRLAKLVTVAMTWSIRGLMGATGIGLAIIALTLLIEHWDEVKAVVGAIVDFFSSLDWGEIWGGIVSGFESVLDFFIDLPGKIIEGVKDAIDAVTGFLADYWKEALILILVGPIGLMIYLFGDTIKDKVSQFGKKALDLVLTPIKDHWKEILITILTGPIGLVVYLFRDQIKAALETVITGAGGLASKMAGWGADIAAAFVDAIAAIPGMIGALWERFKTAAGMIGGQFVAGLRMAFNAIGDLGRGIANAMIDALNWAINQVNAFLPNSIGWGPFTIDLPDNPLPTIPRLYRRQAGGPAAAGVLYAINELGMEFFQPYSSGTVSPIAPAGTGGGSSLVNYGRIVQVIGAGRRTPDVLWDLDKTLPITGR